MTSTNAGETPDLGAGGDQSGASQSGGDHVADIPDDETSVADGDVAADGDDLEGTTGRLA